MYLDMRYRTGDTVRERVATIIKGHPEGLTSDEVRRIIGKNQSPVTIRSYLIKMVNNGTVFTVEPPGQTPVYIPLSEMRKLSPVTRYIRNRSNKEYGTNTMDEETFSMVNEILYLLEQYPDGLTSREIKDKLGSIWDRRATIRAYLTYHVGRILHEEVTDDGEYLFKIIGIESYDNQGGKRDLLPISYLYQIYERFDVVLEDGRIPEDIQDDLIRLIEYSECIKNTTPKDITLKIKFMDGDKRIVTMIYTNQGDGGLMYTMGELNVMTGNELLKWIKCGVVV